MKRLNRLLKVAALLLAAVVTTLSASSCMKEPNPVSEDDFPGTEWSNKENGWLTTLIFTDVRVLLRCKGLGVNNIPNTAYGLSGSYSFDGAGNVLTISFDTVDTGYPNITLPSVIEGKFGGTGKLWIWNGPGEPMLFKRQKPSRQ